MDLIILTKALFADSDTMDTNVHVNPDCLMSYLGNHNINFD